MAQDCDVLIGSNESQTLAMVNNNAPLLGTHQYGICWNGGNVYRSGQFYPYRANITGTVESSTDNSGNVIVTIKNLKIVPSGTDVNYYNQKKYAAPWYGSISSATPAYRAIALAVVTDQKVPAESSSSWHKCLGGWYTAGVSCGSSCVTDRYGNRPGGTWGYWMDKSGSDSAFSTKQYQSFTRNVSDQSWNLGQIAPTNGNTAKIWVIAHWQMGTGYGLNCNIGFSGKSYVAGVSFDIPVLKLCPPEIESVDQDDHVCDNCDDVILTFAANELGGQSSVNLVVDYKYAGQSWNVAESTSVTAYANTETEVTLECVLPSKTLQWRARYELTSGYTAHSDWTTGEVDTLFIPSIGMVVPDLSEEECQTLVDGREIEHYTREVDYYG